MLTTSDFPGGSDGKSLCLQLVTGFPGGSEVKAFASNAEDPGLIPGSRRTPGEGMEYPFQYFCLENLMDREAW